MQLAQATDPASPPPSGVANASLGLEFVLILISPSANKYPTKDRLSRHSDSEN